MSKNSHYGHGLRASMTTLIWSSLSVFGLIAGCGTGDASGDPPQDDLPEYIDCIASLSLTGTFTPAGTPPTPEQGCLPEGTWAVSVSVSDQGECPDVPVDAGYEFVISRDGNDNLSATFAAQGDREFRFSVSSDTGDCKANFEIAAADGLSLILLRPLEVEGAISGSGDYEHYSEPQ